MTSITNKIELSGLLTPDASDSEEDDGRVCKTKREGPVFLAVVRNFTLKEQYTPKEDINRFLALQQRPKDAEESRRNAIRQAMVDSFRTLECARLPPPAYSLRQLQNLEKEKFESLTEEFQRSFLDMCDLVHHLIEPKAINGESLNGFRLAEYMEIIVERINSESSVFLYDTLLAVVRIEEEHNEKLYSEISAKLREGNLAQK